MSTKLPRIPSDADMLFRVLILIYATLERLSRRIQNHPGFSQTATGSSAQQFGKTPICDQETQNFEAYLETRTNDGVDLTFSIMLIRAEEEWIFHRAIEQIEASGGQPKVDLPTLRSKTIEEVLQSTEDLLEKFEEAAGTFLSA